MRLLSLAVCGALLAAVAIPGPALATHIVSARPSAAQASGCASSVGPGIPPPQGVATGLPGYRSAWYGQSGYARMCPYQQMAFTVAFLNTGALGWYGGVMGQSAYLGTWGPEPGQDRASPLGGDGTQGTPNTGWPRVDRIAAQPDPYVGPGQVAWFRFTLQAPKDPGWYRLHLRPLVEGAQWLDDQGIYWEVVVPNPDGSVPPEPVRAATGQVFTTEMAVVASWYGPGFWGNRTACGLTLTADLHGVAHRTLPCGTRVTLRYGSITVTVPVVDRGPFIYTREFDLTYATRLALGCPDVCYLTWLR